MMIIHLVWMLLDYITLWLGLHETQTCLCETQTWKCMICVVGGVSVGYICNFVIILLLLGLLPAVNPIHYSNLAMHDPKARGSAPELTTS